MNQFGFCLEVWGDFACFTRPEMKVERVSYDVITPSAARAIYSAILWKPAIAWRITQIDVLAPIKWISVRRNEVSALASSSPIIATENRTQKASLMLRDVRYRIHAHFDFIPPEKRPKVREDMPEWLRPEDTDATFIREAGKDETPAQYAAMFERRAKKGQCFIRPYLGCRECAAEFKLVGKEGVKFSDDPPIDETRDFSIMLYDMDFSDPKNITPMFFRAKMEKGVIHVPTPDSEEVLK